LNKTSIKQINKKNIINADKHFLNMNVFDYIYITKILFNMINTNDLQLLGHFLHTYGITLDNIEPVLKIDKIGKCKGTISAKKKKILSMNTFNNHNNKRCKITHTKYKKNYYSFIKSRKSIYKDFNFNI